MVRFPITNASEKGTFLGYQSDPKLFAPAYLSSPSINCMVDTAGNAGQRLGFQTELDIDLNTAGKPATSFYLDEYDVTVFASGTKLKYYDWTDKAVYDTGVTLTDGTTTRMDAYTGDVYTTNTTDGLRRLVFFRLNGAVSSGANHITIDADGQARLHVFGVVSGSLIIQGVSEAFVGSPSPTGNISGAANNGAGLIRITTSTSHNLLTGSQVFIAGVVGTTEANSASNTFWTVTVIDATHFDLQSSTFANAYVSGGTYSPNLLGVIKLSGTASQNYTDNTVGVVVSDIGNMTPAPEKASKVFFWKERMGLIGSLRALNADAPNSTEFFSKFATFANLQDIVDFTYGSGGSTGTLVGTFGRITNAIPAKDYLYTFKTNQAYSAAADQVITSGTGIGLTPTDLRDTNNGCLNEDAACTVGDNEVEYITADHRILKIVYSTATGAAVVFPDESFDVPMRELLKNMDKDQTGARSFYHREKHRSIHQIKINGQWVWLIHDNTINAWQPPQYVLFASSFFERKGILYATDGSDDTVYSLWTAFDDNTVPVYCVIATPDLSVGNASMSTAALEGDISQAAIVKMQSFVTNNKGGRQNGRQKRVLGTAYSYSVHHGIGADQVGEGMNGPVLPTAGWQKEFDIYPSEANRCQIIVTNDTGGYMSVYKFSINGDPTPSFSNTL